MKRKEEKYGSAPSRAESIPENPIPYLRLYRLMTSRSRIPIIGGITRNRKTVETFKASVLLPTSERKYKMGNSKINVSRLPARCQNSMWTKWRV